MNTDDITIVDDNGSEHRYKWLLNFVAGNLNKTYSALILQDIQLFRYIVNDVGECGEELADIDFDRAERAWEELQQNNSITDESIRENAVLNLWDSETGEYAPCYGTIFAVFGDFVAFHAPTVHFYRCDVEEKEDDVTMSFSSITNPTEFDDVAEMFKKILAESEKQEKVY